MSIKNWFGDVLTASSNLQSLIHCSPWFTVAQEAAEVCQDVQGRWYAFNLTQEIPILLEKKQLPTHLAGLPCVESPTPFRDVILQLEDAGEVRFETDRVFFKLKKWSAGLRVI